MPTVHVHRERVRFGDLDANRHLNNVVYLRYFETARISFMRELWPDHDPAESGKAMGMIFAECHINYRSPVAFDEEVAVTSWISLRGSSRRLMTRVSWIRHVSDKENRSASPIPQDENEWAVRGQG